MGDPGISLKCATLLAAWRLLFGDRPLSPLLQTQERTKWSVPNAEDATDAVEELALAGGMRSRQRVEDVRR